MKDINVAVISGNLTRDPELRRTQSGMAILTIGVASNYSKKNQQTGQWEDFPNFIDCTMFGNRAEGVANYLQKGTRVYVSGELRWSQWEKDGQKRSKIEILVDDIKWDGGKGNQQQGAYQQPQPAPQQYQQPPMQQGRYAPPAAQYQQPQPQQYQQPQTAPQAAPQPAQPPMQQQMAMPMQQAQPQPAQQPMVQPDTSVYDDDIPF